VLGLISNKNILCVKKKKQDRVRKTVVCKDFKNKRQNTNISAAGEMRDLFI
jgi:hypothetical protein